MGTGLTSFRVRNRKFLNVTLPLLRLRAVLRNPKDRLFLQVPPVFYVFLAGNCRPIIDPSPRLPSSTVARRLTGWRGEVLLMLVVIEQKWGGRQIRPIGLLLNV